MTERNDMVVAPATPATLEGATGAGVLALAQLPDDEFDQRISTLKKGAERIRRIKRELMVPDVHFGVIPGTGDKLALFKSGAETLASIYQLRAMLVPSLEYGNGVDAPPVRALVRCELRVGTMAGPLVAIGYGSSNTWERKHRWRRGSRNCPECGNVGAVIKGKAEYGGGWLCFAKRGGCGAKFADGDERVEGQPIGDIENPDQHDLENTVLKMATKRAFVDAVLRGTASSDIFTQDEEAIDAGPVEDHEPAASIGTRKKPAARKAAAGPAPGAIAGTDSRRAFELLRSISQLRSQVQPGVYDAERLDAGFQSEPSTKAPIDALEALEDALQKRVAESGKREPGF